MIGLPADRDGATRDGRPRLHGTGAALWRWFDREFLRLAVAAGASEVRFPATLPIGTLERAGYFESFPAGATLLPRDEGGQGYALCPAVCYHAYERLQESRIDKPINLTAVQTCFREADRAKASSSRFWEFTMREVILIGPPDWVAGECDAWAQRASALASRLQLRAALEPATDPFFGRLARGQEILQKLKGLKTELRATLGPDAVAVASFNRHETFFASRFGISLSDGAPAHSACAAFGLERWALALLAQRGEDAAAALVAAG